MSFTREQLVASVRNGAQQKIEVPLFGRPLGDVRTMERRAIERWENEGGEIPKEQPQQIGTTNRKSQKNEICIY